MTEITRSRGGHVEKSALIPDLPYFSVVIPVYNDPGGIRQTLDSLVRQDYPVNYFEIIVVDNCSTDHTKEVVLEYARGSPMIRLERECSIQSSYAARNRGILASKGAVIAFIDADMSVGVDWLMRIARSLREEPGDYLACGVELSGNKNTLYEIYDKITGFPIRLYLGNDHFAPTCCLVVHRSLFMEQGLFDSRLISGGDLEFGNRVFESGKHQGYRPDIIMIHPARSSFRSLYQKSFRIGRGLRQLSRFYPERFQYPDLRVWNPVNYLPSTPWNFISSGKRNEIWKELSFIEKFSLYYINWLLKLAKIRGYRAESPRGSGSDFPPA
jgi:glycosyltransferase AglI